MAHDLPILAFQSPDDDTWTLHQDFVMDGPGCSARVPAGYSRFNGASIPRIAWTAIGRNLSPRFVRASLVHDYLYDTPEARDAPHWNGMARTQMAIDDLFRDLLLMDGVAPWKARAMHFAVRSVGAWYFTRASAPQPRRVREPPDEVQMGRVVVASKRGTSRAWHEARAERKNVHDYDQVDDVAVRALNRAALPGVEEIPLFEEGLTYRDVDERLAQVDMVDWEAALKVLEAASDSPD